MKPILRFQAFENDWKKDKLNNLGDFTSGGTPLKSNLDYWNGDIPWITTGDIANLRKENIDNFITEKALEESSAKLIENRAILIAMYGQGKTRGMSAILNFNAATNQACAIFQTDFDINFVYYFFQKSYKYIRSLSNEGSQKNLSLTLLKEIQLNYPSKMEQKKIGEFFSKLDRQIELEEQKLAKLEEQKKGYMQKLFSQELRFKDQDGNDYPKWEKKFIKDIFIFENNRRKPITSSLREKGLYPYYGATGIIDYVKDYLFNNEERLLIGEDGAKWGQFENSSFIANGQYWVNNHAHVVKSNNHNLYFMNYYLNFKELRTFVTGNAPAKLTHANLCNINLEIPCLNEQDKISALLKSIDKKMNNQINKIVLLKRRKQGLLQKMFV